LIWEAYCGSDVHPSGSEARREGHAWRGVSLMQDQSITAKIGDLPSQKHNGWCVIPVMSSKQTQLMGRDVTPLFRKEKQTSPYSPHSTLFSDDGG